MTDFELERLGELWREDPTAEVLEELRRSAAAVKRRALVATILDYALAAAMVVAVLFIVVTEPSAQIVTIGSIAILMLVFSQLRQRRFRKLELKGLAGGTASMIDQSIARAEATLKRTRSGLLVVLPATLVGVSLGFVIDPVTNPFFSRANDDFLSAAILIGIGIAALPAMVIHLFLTTRRCRRELRRLKALREAYRKEEDATVVE